MRLAPASRVDEFVARGGQQSQIAEVFAFGPLIDGCVEFERHLVHGRGQPDCEAAVRLGDDTCSETGGQAEP